MPDLEELYREIILDHYRSPRNRGELPSPPAHRVEGFNPLCGDEVVVTLLVEDGTLADIKIDGTGCSISQSSASLMSGAVKGRSLEEVRAMIRTFKSMMSIHEVTLGGDGATEGSLGAAEDGAGATGGGNGAAAAGSEPEAVDRESLGELAALQGVVKFPVRIKCATLSWNALSQGLRELEAG
jgi:nitrogen fixation protein NifU and related proteins